MIGQAELSKKISDQISGDRFPRFSILVGPTGSGKKTMCKQIASQLKATPYNCEVSVEAIRTMITDAYRVSTKVLYIIADADRMSAAAKNALLKVTEEPPQNAYFVMTLTDANNTLDTIRSRGTIFNMDSYTWQELLTYGKQRTNYTLHDDEAMILRAVCETPGDVNALFPLDNGHYIKDFYSYVEKVVDNIALVSGSNSFKIADKIAMKESDTDKYDLRLFWRVFKEVCMQRFRDCPQMYARAIQITSTYLRELRIVGINKQFSFDCWLLAIRKEWMKWL